MYYEAKARNLKELADVNRGGALNDGYDDLNYDYILHGDEIFAKRYILKHRIGKVREGKKKEQKRMLRFYYQFVHFVN